MLACLSRILMILALGMAVWLPATLAGAASPDAPQVGVRYDLVGHAAVEGGQGGYAVRTLALRAGLWRLRLTYHHSDFIWRDVHRLPLGDGVHPPWDDLHTLELSLRGLDTRRGNWRFRLDPLVQASYESEPSGSLGLGIKGVISWSFAKGWSLYFPYDLMVVSVHNHPSLALIINAGLDFPEQSISRMLTKWGLPPWLANSLDLRLEFSQRQQYFQLSEQNPVDPGGALWINESAVGLILEIKPNDHLAIRLGPEYLFSRSVALDNPVGGEESSWDVDRAWGFSMRLLYRF